MRQKASASKPSSSAAAEPAQASSSQSQWSPSSTGNRGGNNETVTLEEFLIFKYVKQWPFSLSCVLCSLSLVFAFVGSMKILLSSLSSGN
jgi:hypothetical protein